MALKTVDLKDKLITLEELKAVKDHLQDSAGRIDTISVDGEKLPIDVYKNIELDKTLSSDNIRLSQSDLEVVNDALNGLGEQGYAHYNELRKALVLHLGNYETLPTTKPSNYTNYAYFTAYKIESNNLNNYYQLYEGYAKDALTYSGEKTGVAIKSPLDTYFTSIALNAAAVIKEAEDTEFSSINYFSYKTNDKVAITNIYENEYIVLTIGKSNTSTHYNILVKLNNVDVVEYKYLDDDNNVLPLSKAPFKLSNFDISFNEVQTIEWTNAGEKFRIPVSSFSQEQWDAINSGVTASAWTTAQSNISNLQSSLTSTVSRVSTLESRADSVDSSISSINTSINTLSQDLASNVSAINTNIGNLSSAISTTNANLSALSTSFGSFKADITPTGWDKTTNPLATQTYVNDAIDSSSSVFRGTYETKEDLPTKQQIADLHNNDYAFVIEVEAGKTNPEYVKYKYVDTESVSEWRREYPLNNSSFTAIQWAAINSNVTSEWKTSVDAHVSAATTHIGDSTRHITASERTTWNAAASSATILEGKVSAIESKNVDYDKHINDETDKKHVTTAQISSWNQAISDVASAITTIGSVSSRVSAIESKATNYDAHLSNSTIHINASERTLWNGYEAKISAAESKLSSMSIATYEEAMTYLDIPIEDAE